MKRSRSKRSLTPKTFKTFRALSNILSNIRAHTNFWYILKKLNEDCFMLHFKWLTKAVDYKSTSFAYNNPKDNDKGCFDTFQNLYFSLNKCWFKNILWMIYFTYPKLINITSKIFSLSKARRFPISSICHNSEIS